MTDTNRAAPTFPSDGQGKTGTGDQGDCLRRIAAVSATVDRENAEAVASAIGAVVAIAGEGCGADLGWIELDGCAASEDGSRIVREWSRNACDPGHVSALVEQALPHRMREQVAAGDPVGVPTIPGMATATAKDRAVVQQQGVNSLLAVPVPGANAGARRGMLVLGTLHNGYELASREGVVATAAAAAASSLAERGALGHALQASEARYRDLLDNALEGILVLDPETLEVVDCNNSAGCLLGVDQSGLLATSLGWFMPAQQPDGQASVTKVREVIRRCRAGEQLELDWVFRDAGGCSIPCQVRAGRVELDDRIRFTVLDVSGVYSKEAEQVAYLHRTREQQLRLGEMATSEALANGDLGDFYREACRALQGVLRVARATVWLFSDDGHHLERAAGVDGANRDDAAGLLLVNSNRAFIDALGEGRTIAVEDVENDHRISGMRLEYLHPRGIRALLNAPVRVSGELVGFVCAEHADGPRNWRMDEVGFVSGTADQVAQAIINHKRTQAVAALRESEQRYRALYDDNPAMFFTVDEAGFIQSVNRFAADALGRGVEELVGLPFDVLLDDPTGALADDQLTACYGDPGEVHRWDSALRHRDGGTVPVRISARVQPDAAGRSPVLMVCEDISEARQLAEELSYRARHDALTGLCNRREFEERLSQVLAGASERGRDSVLCYMDLDQFKVINDTCGHIAGDELLRQLSGMLSQQLGKGDLLARLGGDEFGVLLEDRTPETALDVADRIRKGVGDFHFTWTGRSFGLGVSIGMVPVARSAGTLHDVMSLADTACYAAKDQGRNRIHVYRSDDSEVARRHDEMHWVSGIRQALAEHRLRLHYQPIVPLCGGDHGHHYELLVRMQGSDGGMVSPGKFLPAAERFNLISLLDRWVIQQAFDFLEAHPGHLEHLDTCAINLSGLSVGDGDFLDWLLRRFRDSRVPGEKICFEITETAAIQNIDIATDFMRQLRGQGCRFALDDFGSGLSSFAYLKNLPVDAVKIDGMFVRELQDDPINQAVVRSINEIGHVMGKQTIAEFVETEPVRDLLRSMGVDFGQGFGLALPRPVTELFDHAD